MMFSGKMGMLAVAASMASIGALQRANERAEVPAQTNTADPVEPIVESRQVRRARERRDAKNRRR